MRLIIDINVCNCYKLFILLSIFVFFLCGHTVQCINLEEKRESRFLQRQYDKRKGDIGELPFWEDDLLPKHPKNILKARSRQKRFLNFPKGGAFDLGLALSMPKWSDDWQSVGEYVALDLSLALPSGPLQLMQFDYETGLPYSKSDNFYDEIEQTQRMRRSIQLQRQTGFNVIENALDNLGLPGKSCLMKAVCESAEEPLEAYGVVGDMFNMFFAPGYGKVNDDLKDFLDAEQRGINGTCFSSFHDCPFHLADLMQSGLSLLDTGLLSASVFQGLRPLASLFNDL